MIKTRIVISNNHEQHEKNMDEVMNQLEIKHKPMIYHKIIRMGTDFKFLTYIHYEDKND